MLTVGILFSLVMWLRDDPILFKCILLQYHISQLVTRPSMRQRVNSPTTRQTRSSGFSFFRAKFPTVNLWQRASAHALHLKHLFRPHHYCSLRLLIAWWRWRIAKRRTSGSTSPTQLEQVSRPHHIVRVDTEAAITEKSRGRKEGGKSPQAASQSCSTNVVRYRVSSPRRALAWGGIYSGFHSNLSCA
jgi:hypothetical protein